MGVGVWAELELGWDGWMGTRDFFWRLIEGWVSVVAVVVVYRQTREKKKKEPRQWGGLGGSGRWNKYLWQAAGGWFFFSSFLPSCDLLRPFNLPVSRRLRERNLFQQCQSSIDERARPRATLRPVVVKTTLAAPSLPQSLRPSTRRPPRRTCPSTLPWSATSPPTVRARAWATTTRRSAATSSGGSSGGRPTPT